MAEWKRTTIIYKTQKTKDWATWTQLNTSCELSKVLQKYNQYLLHWWHPSCWWWMTRTSTWKSCWVPNYVNKYKWQKRNMNVFQNKWENIRTEHEQHQFNLKPGRSCRIGSFYSTCDICCVTMVTHPMMSWRRIRPHVCYRRCHYDWKCSGDKECYFRNRISLSRDFIN